MDNHPIPQDITGFQFKLVGNLTIKQFIYLAVGALLAWIFFFLLNLPTLIKWPLSVISFTSGAMLAFVPIDGRPMDTMIGNFIKAMLAPTQFLYQKSGGKLPANPPASPNQIPIATQALVQPQTQKTPNPTPNINPPTQTVPKEAHPAVVLQSPIPATVNPAPYLPPITNPFPQASFQPSSPAPHGIVEELNDPDDEKTKQEKEEAETQNLVLQGQVTELKKELENVKANAPTPQPDPLPAPAMPLQKSQSQSDLEKQLEEARRHREALEKELLTLKAKNDATSKPTFNPVMAKPLESTQRVRKVPFGMEQTIGIPSIPEAPNLITGIIKDPRGNPLPNILVEVKDQDANPVRAFKTNGLGKFASATSLSNGKYLISFEDPKEQHKFDAIEIEMLGTPVMPLEIISVDPREELRRELFN